MCGVGSVQSLNRVCVELSECVVKVRVKDRAVFLTLSGGADPLALSWFHRGGHVKNRAAFRGNMGVSLHSLSPVKG